MKSRIIILILTLVPFFQGCPYESAVPVANNKLPAIKEMEGVWLNEKERNRSKSIIRVNGNNEYLIRHYKESVNKVDLFEFHAFITRIGNNYIANVFEETPNLTRGGFLLYRVELINPATLKISEVNRYKIPAELNDFDKLQYLKKNLNNPKIYSSAMIWKKDV